RCATLIGTSSEMPESILICALLSSRLALKSSNSERFVSAESSRGSHGTVGPLRVNKLSQRSSEVLLRGRHRELDSSCCHLLVELIEIRDGEAQFDFARRAFGRSGMQRQRCGAGCEFTPFWRLEF